MIQAILVIFTAISLSAVAEYYSVVGLIAIFSSQPLEIAIMGCTLAVTKLVATSWVYRNWNVAPRMLKYYFALAIMILSIITSLGIFGYLSKAHLLQSSINETTQIQLSSADAQITIEEDKLSNLLKQQEKYKIPPLSVQKSIAEAQNNISKLKKEKLPLLQEQNKNNAEIGPIIYISELIYGQKGRTDDAVRVIILALIFVFDPLAILLLIAGNFSFDHRKREKNTNEDGKILVDSDKIFKIS